jgi:hypothetical protein
MLRGRTCSKCSKAKYLAADAKRKYKRFSHKINKEWKGKQMFKRK